MKQLQLTDLSRKQLKTYSALALIFLIGCCFMLLPSAGDTEQAEKLSYADPYTFSIENEEKRLESLLSRIDGVGECRVLLSVHGGSESVLAEDNGETVILKEGSSESIVTVQTIHPAYQGAVIVTGGWSSASVRHNVLASVSAYTGLSADKIAICPIVES